VRPPREIADWLENLARFSHEDESALLREAAEALRAQHRELNRDAGDSMFLSEIVSDLERERNQGVADRDALLAVARAAFVMTDGVRGYFQAPSGWIALEDLLDRLPDHLRRQVEQ
jgi:regulator of RNase E activity RraB